MDKSTWERILKTLSFGIENPQSSFYRDKYKPYELDRISIFKSHSDFFKIPYLEKRELQDTSLFNRLFLDSKGKFRIMSTSGTSGEKPLLVFRGSTPKEHAFKNHRNTLPNTRRELSLLRPQSNVVHSKTPAIRFIGNPYQMEETAAISSQIEIDSIYSSPGMIINFAPYLERFYDLKKIKLLRFISSELTQDLIAIIRNKFEHATLTQEYSLTEFGNIGIQCEFLAKKMETIFHQKKDGPFLEISRESDNAVRGEIVLTHLRPVPSLLIRYRTGDIGELIDAKCDCGMDTALFRLIGRQRLDKIKVMGFEVTPANFYPALKELSDQVEGFLEAHFYQRIVNGKIIHDIVIKVVLKEHSQPTEFMKEIIEDTFNRNFYVSNRLAFNDLVAQGIFSKIKIEFISPRDIFDKNENKCKLIPHF